MIEDYGTATARTEELEERHSWLPSFGLEDSLSVQSCRRLGCQRGFDRLSGSTGKRQVAGGKHLQSVLKLRSFACRAVEGAWRLRQRARTVAPPVSGGGVADRPERGAKRKIVEALRLVAQLGVRARVQSTWPQKFRDSSLTSFASLRGLTGVYQREHRLPNVRRKMKPPLGDVADGWLKRRDGGCR